jgi:hypothetical protein
MADKKISELPLITTISGSIVFVPIVHDGITEKITVEDFSKFTNKYAAQTGSVNIFTANQTINANLSVNGTSTVSGNASVGGNLVVNGKLTAQELFTEITSASIIFESGSTIFGNSGDDTHQFTGVVSINGVSIGAGAINEFTASQLAVNLRIASTTGSINTTTSSFNSEFIKIGLTTSSIHFTTQSLNTQTGSQDLVNLRISSTTGSINTTTSSFDSVFLRISSTTGSINTTTSSFDSVFLRISSTTGSINTTTSSFDSEFIKIGSTTSSIHFTTQSLNTQTGSQANLNAQIGIATASLNFSTGALNAFTGSVIGQTNTISTFTASVNFTTQSLNTQTGSQNSINFNISVVTSSIDAHILKQATQTGSQDLVNYNISVVTSSINAHILKQATQTGSQDLVNYQNSIITSSYRIELNSIEAYTSSLKSAIIVNGTNVQIVGNLDVARLNVQYVSSSVLVTSGSNVFGDASNDKHEFTGSVNIKDALYVNNTLFVNGQAVALGELNAFTGSQIGKDFTLSVVTSSIDAHILKQATQTGSQDLVNLGISTYTGSQNVINTSVNAHILKQAIQTGSQDLVNLGISTYTGSQNVINSSVDAHILKQAIQTGSQDLVNLGISTYTGSQNVINTSVNSHILAQSTQTGSQDLVNLGISTFTGSLRSEVNGIEAYTASLKGAAIVSSSQQITNYYKFAETASANTFYGNQTFASSGGSGLRVYGGAGTHQWDMYLNGQNIRLSDNTTGDGALIVDTRAYFGGHVTASGNISVGGSGFISPGGADKFIGVYSGQDSSIILQDSVETWEIYMNDDLYFTTGSTSPKNVMSLRRITGNVEINEGNLVIGKAGKGIDFSITSNGSGTMTSEILSDYEEGTWTPTFAGTGGNTGQVYGSQDGTYTKVGRLVTFTANVSLTTLGTITGFVRIDGLPFTPQSVPGSRPATTHATGTTITTLPASDVYGGNTFMYLYKISQTNPTAATQLSQGDLTNTTNWQVNGFYYTA